MIVLKLLTEIRSLYAKFKNFFEFLRDRFYLSECRKSVSAEDERRSHGGAVFPDGDVQIDGVPRKRDRTAQTGTVIIIVDYAAHAFAKQKFCAVFSACEKAFSEFAYTVLSPVSPRTDRFVFAASSAFERVISAFELALCE